MPAAVSTALFRPFRSTGLVYRALAALTLHRQRVRLATLDDHMLRDIGLTRDEAVAEAARPVWDVPPYWRR